MYYNEYSSLIICILKLSFPSQQYTFRSLCSLQVNIVTELYTGLIVGFLFLLYPVSGWLADVYLSRIKTMVSGMAMIVLGDVLSLVLVFTYPDALLAGFVIIIVGHTFFEVNAILFGLDQLQTYSTENHQAFVYWYYWTTQVGHFLYGLSLCAGYETSGELGFRVNVAIFCLVQMGLLFLVMVVIWKWWKKFIRHSVGFYPFKNIVRVLSYAVGRKSSSHPSAFTYGDKKTPSRLDMAKMRHGGPFSTEQVEDVKVFFHILFLLMPLSIYYYVDDTYNITRQFQHSNSTNPINYGQCLLTEVHSWMRSTLCVFLIPVYLLVLRPLLQRVSHFSWLLWRMGWSLLIALCAVLALLGIEIHIAVYQAGHSNISFVTNVTNCYAGDALSFYWLIIPEFLYGLSYIIIFSTGLEFICAQAPQGMKGLFIGLWYSFEGLDLVIISIQNYFQLDCFSGYFVAKAIIVFGFIVWYGYAARRYQFRKRQDIYNQSDLEDHYTQILQQEDNQSDGESMVASGHIQSIIRPETSYRTMEVMKY